MSFGPREQGPPTTDRSEWKRQASGIAVSVLVHVVMMGFVALIHFGQPNLQLDSQLLTTWSTELEREGDVDPVREPTPIESLPRGDSLNPGGSSWGQIFDLTSIASSEELPSLAEITPTSFGRGGGSSRSKSRAKKQGENNNRGSIRPGAGKGLGQGDGIGNGKGFFGSVPEGKRIVFVVDNSRSMNEKHDSEAKTRFRRVKVELIKSIVELPPESEFFVVFFCNETVPMPAESLQPATPQAKDHYLRWVAQVDSGGGPTDPRGAMQLALRLQPDVIYFLTDGEFKRGVNLTLLSIKPSRTAIHTFSFGEKLGEDVLQELARRNNGDYKFVP